MTGRALQNMPQAGVWSHFNNHGTRRERAPCACAAVDEISSQGVSAAVELRRVSAAGAFQRDLDGQLGGEIRCISGSLR